MLLFTPVCMEKSSRVRYRYNFMNILSSWGHKTVQNCCPIYVLRVCVDNYFTYLLTPWSRALLEKLTGSAASQKIPRIFGTRRFITILTSARHLSLSWTNSIHSPQRRTTSWRSILILSFHLRLGLHNSLFPSGFPTRTSLFSPIRATCPTHRIKFPRW